MKKEQSAIARAILKPREGFDWKRLTWGRPDSVPTILCSYCSASIPESSIPLIMSNDEGWTVRFCDDCVSKWFIVATEP